MIKKIVIFMFALISYSQAGSAISIGPNVSYMDETTVTFKFRLNSPGTIYFLIAPYYTEPTPTAGEIKAGTYRNTIKHVSATITDSPYTGEVTITGLTPGYAYDYHAYAESTDGQDTTKKAYFALSGLVIPDGESTDLDCFDSVGNTLSFSARKISCSGSISTNFSNDGWYKASPGDTCDNTGTYNTDTYPGTGVEEDGVYCVKSAMISGGKSMYGYVKRSCSSDAEGIEAFAMNSTFDSGIVIPADLVVSDDCTRDTVPTSNTAPTFDVGATNTLSVAEDASATDIKAKLLVTDSDTGDTLTWSQSSAPSHGTLSFSGATASGGTNVSSGGTITYTPTANYNGADSFIVQVDDGNGGTDTITINVTVTATPNDTDTTLTASATVDESTMIPIPTTANTLAEKVDLFDFKISDTASSDTETTDITQVVISTVGSNADLSKMKFLLNGTNVSNVEGVYNSGANTLTFASLSISVASGANETYTLSTYFQNPTGLTDNETFTFSVTESSFTLDTAKSTMASSQSVSNGANAKVDITATKLIFTQQPSNQGVN